MILFLFLILLISCWAVAASLVAEETNAEVAVFVADITSMCGVGSDGVAALLSACSFVCCCSHRQSSRLEMLFQGTLTLCNQLQGRAYQDIVSIAFIIIPYADIFISQARAAGGSPPQSQLTVDGPIHVNLNKSGVDLASWVTICNKVVFVLTNQNDISSVTGHWL